MGKSGFKKFGLILMAGFTLGIGFAACTNTTHYIRDDIAKRIAAPAWMNERTIPAGPFLLTAYERVHESHAPANVYIEGDGVSWISRRSSDPTPVNPVALNLAAMDKADNVLYLARPCQYSKLRNPDVPCPERYWTKARYAPEVIDAINEALDDMKTQYDITEFNLIGFSGGANIAALLAARRDDVVSLRTVAGKLDHHAHSEYHNAPSLDNSLNAVKIAPEIADLPQRHFIGGQDKNIPPAIAHSFVQTLGSGRCAEITMIQEAEHKKGWGNKWPELLKMPVECKTPDRNEFIPYNPPKDELVPFDPPKKIEREEPAKP